MKHRSPQTTRNVRPKRHDPYRSRSEHPGALVCKHCGIVRHAGRWYEGAPPVGAETVGICPACARIRDGQPAGAVRIEALPQRFHGEIVRLVHNVADHERREHPLERLMRIEQRPDGLLLTTTGTHLARCIGGALRRRFHGGVTVQYPPESDVVSVRWSG